MTNTVCGLFTYDPLVGVVATAVRCGKRGGAFLRIPGGQTLLGGAADGDGVDAVRVSVTVTVVALTTPIARCPDKDGTFPATTL